MEIKTRVYQIVITSIVLSLLLLVASFSIRVNEIKAWCNPVLCNENGPGWCCAFYGGGVGGICLDEPETCGGGGNGPPQCPPGTVVQWYTPAVTQCTGNRYYGPQYEWKRPAGYCAREWQCEECGNAYHPNKICCEWFTTNVKVEWGYCAPICSATAPTGLAYNPSDQNLSWTAGTGGTSQQLYVSDDSSQLADNCAAAVCAVEDTNAVSPYNLTGILSSDTVYYAKVINYKDASCSSSSATASYLSSCSFSNPSINVIKDDPPRAFNLSVNSSGAITNVTFASADTGVATVTSPDTTYVYSTNVSGISVGSTTVTSNVYFGATLACTANAGINVFNPYPWWQVVDGNVHANSGGISSQIPYSCGGACRPNLITGIGGLLSFNGSANLGNGTISEDGSDWQAETVYKGTRTGFGYFKRILSDDPAGIGVWDGGLPAQSGVYLAAAGVTTSGTWNIGASENFVLLVDGNVTVNTDIDVAPGGFLAIIASGDINLDPAVTNIEGVFITDGTLSTGSSNAQLTAEGIFTGWTGFNLQRDLDDDTNTPAELFVYRPDLQLNAYKYLLWLNIDWKEVAP